jgi:hypothetical protein
MRRRVVGVADKKVWGRGQTRRREEKRSVESEQLTVEECDKGERPRRRGSRKRANIPLNEVDVGVEQ